MIISGQLKGVIRSAMRSPKVVPGYQEFVAKVCMPIERESAKALLTSRLSIIYCGASWLTGKSVCRGYTANKIQLSTTDSTSKT